AADQIVSAGVEEIHGDDGEELGRPALEEDDIMRIAQAKELLAAGDGFIIDGLEFLAAMADFCDAKAFALVIKQGGGGFFEHFGREHGGAGTEIENAMRHCV